MTGKPLVPHVRAAVSAAQAKLVLPQGGVPLARHVQAATLGLQRCTQDAQPRSIAPHVLKAIGVEQPPGPFRALQAKLAPRAGALPVIQRSAAATTTTTAAATVSVTTAAAIPAAAAGMALPVAAAGAAAAVPVAAAAAAGPAKATIRGLRTQVAEDARGEKTMTMTGLMSLGRRIQGSVILAPYFVDGRPNYRNIPVTAAHEANFIFEQCYDKAVRVQNINVDPKSMKLGELLIARVAAWAQLQGIRYVVALKVEKALTFYERLGFVDYYPNIRIRELQAKKKNLEDSMREARADVDKYAAQYLAVVEGLQNAALIIEAAALLVNATQIWSTKWKSGAYNGEFDEI
jgi:hypothetical protein